MRTIAAYYRLSSSDRRLVLRSWYLLVTMTLNVRWRPLKDVVQAIDARAARRRTVDSSPAEAIRLCAAAARRVWPRPTCLVNALALYQLLHEQGSPVTLVVGGLRAGAGLDAHAWLERDGVVVLGAPVDRYQPIWRWSGSAASESLRS